ncbi:MAG: homoserine dehydrogenase [Clostridia bacterium]|nr:homoserine dehydrogenase [Clostridia bacterium]
MNVAIMGFGVVGSGVAEVLKNNAAVIEKKCGVSLRLSHILDIRTFPGSPFAPYMTRDVNDILNDADTDIVVETMGGTEPAFTFVSACLNAGKHVVTSNKELVAKKGYQLLELAKKNGVNFFFEAAVGGGIPIIRPLSRCLAGNNITRVAGILNGTTNFILTKMIVEQMDFAAALRLAQQNGYAEKDPTADVEGIDACRKICILASLAFGSHVYPDGIFTEGISALTLDDVAAAEALGCVIKLIAQTRRLENGKISVLVSPALIKKTHLLSGVSDVFNACLITGDAVGDVIMVGRGAGKEATASAVVGDIIDCVDHSSARKTFGWGDAVPGLVEDIDAVPAAFLVRAETSSKDSDTVALAAALPGCTMLDSDGSTLLFVTPSLPQGKIKAALNAAPLRVRSMLRFFEES